MEEELKSIRLELDYYDEDGNKSAKVFSIKVTKPKNISEKSMLGQSKKAYSMSFSLVLPDHIHKNIIGQTLPRIGIGARNDTKSYAKDFSKTITYESLKSVCDTYHDIIQDYKWLKSIEKAELQKVIFYDFDNNSIDYKSLWNGSHFGKGSKLKYLYSIGYISHGVKQNRYNNDKLFINVIHDIEFYEQKFVFWTEERQAFFDNIQKSFAGIMDKINEFEEHINEKSLDNLIENKQLLI